MKLIRTKQHEFALHERADSFTAALSVEEISEGLNKITILLTSEKEAVPEVRKLTFEHPISDIHASWHPASDRNRGFKADWMRSLRSNAATSAPVIALFNVNDQNRLTFAYSDALNTVQYLAGVHEESGVFHCSLELFTEVTAPITSYTAQLLIDTRDIPYFQCLEQVGEWWGRMPEYDPAPVPESARTAMYSTWYSMHQQVTAQDIEEQSRLAKSMGMDAVIVDDGWQTDDNRRGYAYTGDWEVCESKIPNMAALVESVQQMGMRFLLWYSVPFVGKQSKAWDRFRHKLLKFNERHGAGTIDPRYPDVREYIINTYEQALRSWNLDGFKLDFIDQFYVQEEDVLSSDPGRDILSIPAAVDRLLTDTIARLRAIKTDVMIEFRQMYIGPAMRKYGNMFRAADCPNDSIHNRVRTLDIRLLSGNTATHSDMLMWYYNEPVESAALQFINILFSVPQVSVWLDRVPERHQEMIRFWLKFWKQHRDILLDGVLRPQHPELLYPVVSASNKAGSSITVSYHDELITAPAPRQAKQWTLINGRLKEGLFIQFLESQGTARVLIKNCLGVETSAYMLVCTTGIHKLDIPAAGIAVLEWN